MNAESHSDRCGVFLVCSDRLASSDLFELVRNSVPVGSIWHCNVTMTAVVVHVAFSCELAILCLALSQVLTALLCSLIHNWETAVWLMIKVTKFHTQLTTTLMLFIDSVLTLQMRSEISTNIASDDFSDIVIVQWTLQLVNNYLHRTGEYTWCPQKNQAVLFM